MKKNIFYRHILIWNLFFFVTVTLRMYIVLSEYYLLSCQNFYIIYNESETIWNLLSFSLGIVLCWDTSIHPIEVNQYDATYFIERFFKRMLYITFILCLILFIKHTIDASWFTSLSLLEVPLYYVHTYKWNEIKENIFLYWDYYESILFTGTRNHKVCAT